MVSRIDNAQFTIQIRFIAYFIFKQSKPGHGNKFNSTGDDFQGFIPSSGGFLNPFSIGFSCQFANFASNQSLLPARDL